MNNKLELTTNNRSIINNIASWLFGIAVLAAGLVNMFWGNDPEFGVFIALLSFVYFFPVNAILRKITGFSIPGIGIVKIILAFLLSGLCWSWVSYLKR